MESLYRWGMKETAMAAAIVLAAGVLASCGRGEEEIGELPTTNQLGPVHVHALDVNPADGALFIATHTGMFRIADGEDEAARVGDNYQDTMGFTAVGADRFLGSGHPDLRDDLPPFLGLIESDDAGEAWDPVSLLGRADFHVLEAAGQRIYGFGSDFETRREQLLKSRDGGRSWQPLSFPESMLSLAIDPTDPDQLLMSGRRTLFRSTDAGESWQPVSGEPGLLGWSDAGLFLVTADGSVATTDAPGGTWQEAGDVDGEPAAFEAESETLYVALHDGSIKESIDGGETWALRSSP